DPVQPGPHATEDRVQGGDDGDGQVGLQRGGNARFPDHPEDDPSGERQNREHQLPPGTDGWGEALELGAPEGWAKRSCGSVAGGSDSPLFSLTENCMWYTSA